MSKQKFLKFLQHLFVVFGQSRRIKLKIHRTIKFYYYLFFLIVPYRFNSIKAKLNKAAFLPFIKLLPKGLSPSIETFFNFAL